ncbi:MAG: aldo/keto reductase [Candidatus Omnitrophota bacterium]|nr:MAG: aldo/keto reductase [Candidatus Omnitrophota bacterium]
MEYRKMGKWGLRLSCLGLGSYLTIGFKCDEKTSRDIIKVAYDNGINFFDTANVYNHGEAERVLGKCLKDFPRSSFVVLTKVWGRMGPGPNDRGLSAKHIFEQCHASLRRMGMDYVDIYMCHRPDLDTPLEETIRAMEDLARQGKILYWGVSEWSAAQIVKAQKVAKEMGARPISVSEPRYNLLYRYPEKEIFPLTAEEGIGNVIFSPLAHGMLTGKYIPGQPPPESSRAADPEQNTVIMKLYWSEENKKKGQKFLKIAQEMGATAAQLAIAWCLRRPEVTSVILGTRTVGQLKENLKAVELKIPDGVMEKLDKLYPPVGEIPTV